MDNPHQITNRSHLHDADWDNNGLDFLEIQKRLEEILSHSRDILYRRDLRTGQYNYVSRAFGDILGYTEKEVAAMVFEGVEALIHPDDRLRHNAFIQQMIDSESGDRSLQDIEYRMRHKNGTYLWFLDSMSIVRDAAGKPLFLIGNNRDITAQKEADIALKDAHERFLTVLNSLDAHIYVADMTTYEIVFINHRMQKAFGYNLEGQLCFAVFRNETAPCSHCSNPELLDADGNPTGVYTWECRNPLTNRWYLNHDRAIKWVDGRWVRLQIATDITKLKRLEHHRLETEAQMQHVQKMEAIGTLAGGIAHDFNNLLMGVLGNISMILADTDTNHANFSMLKSAENHIQSATKLTRQLLGYARKGQYEIMSFNLNELVKEISEAFGRTRKEIRLNLNSEQKELAIEADQGQIEQVLWNLLINAADAMPSGGNLHINISLVDHTKMQHKPYRPKAGAYAHLQVTDTGDGMDAQTMDRIFEPFFTTKKRGQGTGLGLASVYGIIKGHGGYIDVDSVVGQGSTFSIYLPASNRTMENKSMPTVKTKTSIGGTILLVDDEPVIRDISTRMLEKLGYDVIAVESGQKALDAYGQSPATVDLIILDMIMPDMSGGETFDQLKAMDPDVKVLLSSGYSKDGQATEIINKGCAGFLQKPFCLDSLGEKVQQTLSSGK